MCLACIKALDEFPAFGYLLASNSGVSFAGVDSSGVVQLMKDRLPTSGRAVVVKTGDRWQLRRALPGELLNHHEICKHESAPAILCDVQHVGGYDEEQVLLLESLSVVVPTDAQLDGLAKSVAVVKAPLDPLDPNDFDKIVARLAAMLQRTAGKVEQEALEDFIDWSVRIDWTNERDMLRATKRLNVAMGQTYSNTWVGIKGTIEESATQTAAQTRAATVKTYDLLVAASMKQPDVAAVIRAAKAQAHYVRDYYTNTLDSSLSATMRTTVQHGMEQGLSTRDIGKRVHKSIAKKTATYSRGYYNMVASAVDGRSRAFSQLTAYKDAGIRAYVISAVLDEITTNICRMLDGKRMDVGRGLNRYKATDGLKDPMGVKHTQPWFAERIIQDGEHEGEVGLFIPRRRQDALAAVVTRSAVGQSDRRGSFSGAMSAGKLMDNNIGAPPYHGHCRTTLVPDI